MKAHCRHPQQICSRRCHKIRMNKDGALARMVEHYPQLLKTLRREQRREWLPNTAKRLPGLTYRAVRKLYRALRRRLAK